MVWKLIGTESQNRIVASALSATTFPFDVIQQGLRAKTGRDTVPVEWADLSRYRGESSEFATVERREQVLGLAWYSGKVSLDLSLESNQTLAQEVFLSEGAHMLDFFWMTDEHRAVVWNAMHADDQQVTVSDTGEIAHGHSWFDIGEYESWVGESWMGMFVLAYSKVPLTIDFDHTPSSDSIVKARAELTPYFASSTGLVHDRHNRIKVATYLTREQVLGRRLCRTCLNAKF